MKRELPYTHEVLAQRKPLLNEMKRIADRMKQAAGTAEFHDLMKQHDVLEKRHDAIWPTEEGSSIGTVSTTWNSPEVGYPPIVSHNGARPGAIPAVARIDRYSTR